MSEYKLEFNALTDLDVIDQLIYEDEECFYWTEEKMKAYQLNLIKDSFTYHYNNCGEYKNYCTKFDFGPEDIRSYKDLEKIPLITSSMFKLKELITGNKEDVVKICTSSGTKGSVSRVYRDEITLNRFLGSLQSTLDNIFNIDDAFCFNLGPSTEEAGDLWFSYVLSVVDMIFPTENYVKEDIFSPHKVVEDLYKYQDKFENLIITGAPIMMLQLLEYLQENDIEIQNSEKIYFITAGGWKRFSGQSIPKADFFNKITKSFIGADESKFRDSLNMVELNTILPECQYKTKHIVPWVKIMIINPINGQVVEDGEMGLIAYLDPSAHSFPCFVLTDDIGRINVNGTCKCGRFGQGLEIIRRVKSIESRGCALKIDKRYAKTK